MFRLTLVRHAKSSWKDHDLTDLERPLSKRGKKDLAVLLSKLGHSFPLVDCVVFSPAKRTHDTAEALRALWPNATYRAIPELYAADPRQLISVVRDHIGNTRHLLLVGHHPSISEFACALSVDLSPWLPLKEGVFGCQPVTTLTTSGLASFRVQGRSWSEIKRGAACDTLILPSRNVDVSTDNPSKAQLIRNAKIRQLCIIRKVLALKRLPTVKQVHQLRLACKEIRALQRLERSQGVRHEWKKRDVALRDISRLYAPLRQRDAFKHAMKTHRATVELESRKTLYASVTWELRSAAMNVMDALLGEASGQSVLAPTNQTIENTLKCSFKRARRYWKRAVKSPSRTSLHEWRMTTKNLLMQLRVIDGEVCHGGLISNLELLVEALGNVHDAKLMKKWDTGKIGSKPLDRYIRNLITLCFELGSKIFSKGS